MKYLVQAISFLSILPFHDDDAFSPAKALPWFPVVGLILGAVVSMLDGVLLWLWPKSVASVVDVVLLAGLSGAFHLDGLGDTADGLLGYRSRERALEIMKDSRVGAMGVVAITCCLILKWAGLAAVGTERTLLLILIPALSRTTALIAMKTLPYGRQSGTGKAFFGEPVPWVAWATGVLPMSACVVLGWRGLLLLGVYAASVLIVLGWYRKRMGCITGDMMGGLIEVCETALLLAAALGGGGC